MNRGEGILPAGLVERGAEVQGTEVQGTEVQGTEVQGAAVWGALVRCMSCHTAQAIICLKAAGPSLRMFRQFHCLRWNILGSVLIAEENNSEDGGAACWGY